MEDPAGQSDHDVESTAAWLHEVGLAGPAYLLLHGLRPLSFVGEQSLLFLQPLLPHGRWRAAVERIAGVLGDRRRVEELLTSLEARVRGPGGARRKENAR